VHLSDLPLLLVDLSAMLVVVVGDCSILVGVVLAGVETFECLMVWILLVPIPQ
jgi:vacuolar-type H+-ATPase subunit F/Vma7